MPLTLLTLSSTLSDFLAVAETLPGFAAPGVPGCEPSRKWLTSRFRLDVPLREVCDVMVAEVSFPGAWAIWVLTRMRTLMVPPLRARFLDKLETEGGEWGPWAANKLGWSEWTGEERRRLGELAARKAYPRQGFS